jgi:hypothetical protein
MRCGECVYLSSRIHYSKSGGLQPPHLEYDAVRLFFEFALHA